MGSKEIKRPRWNSRPSQLVEPILIESVSRTDGKELKKLTIYLLGTSREAEDLASHICEWVKERYG